MHKASVVKTSARVENVHLVRTTIIIIIIIHD